MLIRRLVEIICCTVPIYQSIDANGENKGEQSLLYDEIEQHSMLIIVRNREKHVVYCGGKEREVVRNVAIGTDK